MKELTGNLQIEKFRSGVLCHESQGCASHSLIVNGLSGFYAKLKCQGSHNLFWSTNRGNDHFLLSSSISKTNWSHKEQCVLELALLPVLKSRVCITTDPHIWCFYDTYCYLTKCMECWEKNNKIRRDGKSDNFRKVVIYILQQDTF